MAETPAHPADAETSPRFERQLGRYIAAVAEQLARCDMPVREVQYEGPQSDSAGADAVPANALIAFAPEFQCTLAQRTSATVTLEWTPLDGWYLCREREMSDTKPEMRWMGPDPVPAPDRVEAFVSAALTEFTAAGADACPIERTASDGHAELLDRLSRFEPPAGT